MLVIGTMLLRTFRLAEPYQMHFDEVYHARTATEFLQYWRYGLSHDIYEWTHPHLAKYAMAGGLVLWGEDHVSATSDLEAPVRAVAVEPRRVDELAADQHAGERLHVATGTEIRTYDLRTRQLISTIPAAGAAALAIDATGNQLVIGYDDGRIATLDLTAIAIGGAGVRAADHRAAGDRRPPRRPPARDRRRRHSWSPPRPTGCRRSISTAGRSPARSTSPAIADLAPGGSGPALMASVDDVADPSAAASTIAGILSTDAADYASRLAGASPGTTVVLGDPGTGDARTKLDTAISNGTLPGISVGNVSRIAVATADGVAFVDPARASVVSTILLDGGAHGLAMVTGLDNPKLYATAGDAGEADLRGHRGRR